MELRGQKKINLLPGCDIVSQYHNLYAMFVGYRTYILI